VTEVAAGIEGRGWREEEREATAGEEGTHGVLGEGRFGAAEKEREESLGRRRTPGLLLDQLGEAELAVGGEEGGGQAEGEGGEFGAIEYLLLSLLQACEELIGGTEVEIEGDTDLGALPSGLAEIVIDTPGRMLAGPDEGHTGGKDTTLINC
jgi:hypothetical protein